MCATTADRAINIADRLEKAGLRTTQQRLELGKLLFVPGDRHVTAENLFQEAQEEGLKISLATVYNTLHQFTDAGLLREVSVVGSTTFFDTNINNHCHFFDASTGKLYDIDAELIEVLGLPTAPEGKRISSIDVVVHLADEN